MSAATVHDAFGAYWVLDRARSDPPTAHLEALGLPDLARSAAEKLDVSMLVVLHPGGVRIRQDSVLGEKDRTFVFGEEYREAARDGTPIRIVVDAVGSSQLRTVVDWGRARITETKTLNSVDSVLVQEISLSMKGGKPTKTTRVFVRGRAPEG
jgi:hypothetical protein